MAACFVVAIFCWGFGFYGQGVYIVALQQHHHWNLSLVSGASTTYFLFGAFLVIFVGDAITRFGPRNVILFGAACLSISTALVGQVDAIWQLYADYILMSFGWATMSVAAISTIISAWFDERRGLALTLALAGASAGGIIIIPILLTLISWVGLSLTVIVGAITMLLVLVPMTLVWIDRPQSVYASRTVADSAAVMARSGKARRRAFRDLGFWTVSVATALALFIQVGFSILQIDFLVPRIGAAEAGIGVAITAASALLGRFILGGIIDQLPPRMTAAISYASQAAALAAMVWTTSDTVLLIACAVYGFSIGNVLVFPALIIQREFSASAFPSLISFAIAITQFTYALGPGVLGWLRSATGSYDIPLMLCVALEILAVVIILIRSNKTTSQLIRSIPDA